MGDPISSVVALSAYSDQLCQTDYNNLANGFNIVFRKKKITASYDSYYERNYVNYVNYVKFKITRIGRKYMLHLKKLTQKNTH